MNLVKKDCPLDATLAKYGLSRPEFKAILERQGNICPICFHIPKTGRWVIDHKHVSGYKKLSPEKRKELVRGITCWYCNRWHLAKGMSIEKADNIIAYLEEFERRKP